ncbi:helix-turn-helix domain-containing protein [Sulfitobacter sp. 1A13730]|uniref:helix-turn-helix domain-containing protein n=1 Tax=Sulfitobacter sp. 1A13730 TaxID=3368569 RepID=UPI00374603DC
MSMKTKIFREYIRKARPDLAEHQAKNVNKRLIEVQLRALRDALGMTQAKVAEAAGITQSVIARLEDRSGPALSLEFIERYVVSGALVTRVWRNSKAAVR